MYLILIRFSYKNNMYFIYIIIIVVVYKFNLKIIMNNCYLSRS